MTDPNEEYVSFEKALRDLQLQSEQLKKMVSQGDIRAFRDGDSMQFRAEDVAALRARTDGEEELVFADALEDDTGMVTEELSEEDTLLVEDDLDDDEEEVVVVPRTRSRREAITVGAEKSGSTFAVAMAILGALVMLWGSLIAFSISAEARPDDSVFTSIWAKN